MTATSNNEFPPKNPTSKCHPIEDWFQHKNLGGHKPSDHGVGKLRGKRDGEKFENATC